MTIPEWLKANYTPEQIETLPQSHISVEYRKAFGDEALSSYHFSKVMKSLGFTRKSIRDKFGRPNKAWSLTGKIEKACPDCTNCATCQGTHFIYKDTLSLKRAKKVKAQKIAEQNHAEDLLSDW